MFLHLLVLFLAMPRTCCVPGCKSNYRSSIKTEGPVTTYVFPSDAKLKKKWIRAIHRDAFEPNDKTVVCIKHFSDCYIVREDKGVRSDGSLLVVPRKIPLLVKGAVPTIFENQPTYMSKNVSLRKSPEERANAIIRKDEEIFVEWCKNDKISSFNEMKVKLSKKNLLDYKYEIHDEYIILFKVSYEPYPTVHSSIKIDNNWNVNISADGLPDPISKLQWLLGNDLVCDS